MAAMFLNDLGRLDETAEILDVGAGSEEIAFWLACRAARVVAIDIYGEGSFAYREAADEMLRDPASLAPYEYPRDRLEVQSMDARRLAFADASFDVVVSFSSIEHFGTPSDIARSAREIGRVLKPGGHAFIVTEVLVDQHWSDRAPIHFALRMASFGRLAPDATTPRLRSIGDQFTKRELRKRIIEPSGLELMQPLDLSISAPSFANVIDMNGPEPRPTTGAEHPHVVLRSHRSCFTSICLPLVKPR